MSARRREVEVGAAHGRRLVVDLCRELDVARVAAGLSYEALGRAVGLSGDQVGRICRAEQRTVGVLRLAMLYATVGLELSARGYPAGPPIRDAAHVALLARFRVRLPAKLTFRTEVPVMTGSVLRERGVVAADRRAWDAVLGGDGFQVAVEAETRIRDVQALLRRLALKRRDGDVDRLILLLNDTIHNRRMIALAEVALRDALPESTRHAMQRLGKGACPDADAIVIL